MEMQVAQDDANQITLMILNGRLDVEGVQAIEKEFQGQVEACNRPVLLNLEHVTFMGSLGIRLLLGAAKTLQQRSLRAVLLNPPPLVEDTWYSAGLAEIVPVEHELAGALALCRETA
ncbi:MAG: STAS domain-containing protein [Kiritimatiellia bacterium]|nr:STAS domain-containing protein [Lentisphaerota bacterium]